MAQPGRALGSGPRGRRFKSSRPDQRLGKKALQEYENECALFLEQNHLIPIFAFIPAGRASLCKVMYSVLASMKLRLM